MSSVYIIARVIKFQRENVIWREGPDQAEKGLAIQCLNNTVPDNTMHSNTIHDNTISEDRYLKWMCLRNRYPSAPDVKVEFHNTCGVNTLVCKT